MLKIAEFRDFIKRQADFHLRARDKALNKMTQVPGTSAAKRAHDSIGPQERLIATFQQMVEAIDADVAYVEQIHNEKVPAAALKPIDGLDALLSNPTSFSPTELGDLPTELVDQLQITDSDRFEWDVVGLINRTPDKIISITVLLIALYRLTGKVYDRTDLANRIYRLGRKGAVFGVPGKKGWYTTIPQNGQLDLATDESEMDT